MEIINYPHPTLRHKSKPIRRVDKKLREIVAEMFEAMYKARGIGLAANQVDLPLQLFIINTSGKKGKGEELVFLNPVISNPKGKGEAEEGCLSIPGVNASVNRPAGITVTAYDLTGNEIEIKATGLLARAIQHEFDHLNGILFIDRISDSEKKQIAGELDEFDLDFHARRQSGTILSDKEINNRLASIEEEYC